MLHFCWDVSEFTLNKDNSSCHEAHGFSNWFKMLDNHVCEPQELPQARGPIENLRDAEKQEICGINMPQLVYDAIKLTWVGMSKLCFRLPRPFPSPRR